MPGTVQSLINAARAEWNHWGNSTWNLLGGGTGIQNVGQRDDNATFAQYVIANYCSVGGGRPTIAQIQDDEYFWSAVGMSAIFSRAGFTRGQFPFSQAHSTWIKAFVAARNSNQPALYHGYRINEAAASPQVGDMVGYTYANVSIAQAQTYFDKTGSYKSHTDVVVARRAGEIDVIGANVLDSVTMKTLPLDAGGQLIPDRKHKWFVVLRRQGF